MLEELDHNNELTNVEACQHSSGSRSQHLFEVNPNCNRTIENFFFLCFQPPVQFLCTGVHLPDDEDNLQSEFLSWQLKTRPPELQKATKSSMNVRFSLHLRTNLGIIKVSKSGVFNCTTVLIWTVQLHHLPILWSLLHAIVTSSCQRHELSSTTFKGASSCNFHCSCCSHLKMDHSTQCLRNQNLTSAVREKKNSRGKSMVQFHWPLQKQFCCMKEKLNNTTQMACQIEKNCPWVLRQWLVCWHIMSHCQGASCWSSLGMVFGGQWSMAGCLTGWLHKWICMMHSPHSADLTNIVQC